MRRPPRGRPRARCGPPRGPWRHPPRPKRAPPPPPPPPDPIWAPPRTTRSYSAIAGLPAIRGGRMPPAVPRRKHPWAGVAHDVRVATTGGGMGFMAAGLVAAWLVLAVLATIAGGVTRHLLRRPQP